MAFTPVQHPFAYMLRVWPSTKEDPKMRAAEQLAQRVNSTVGNKEKILCVHRHLWCLDFSLYFSNWLSPFTYLMKGVGKIGQLLASNLSAHVCSRVKQHQIEPTPSWNHPSFLRLHPNLLHAFQQSCHCVSCCHRVYPHAYSVLSGTTSYICDSKTGCYGAKALLTCLHLSSVVLKPSALPQTCWIHLPLKN